jgi:hypothetical protein
METLAPETTDIRERLFVEPRKEDYADPSYTIDEAFDFHQILSDAYELFNLDSDRPIYLYEFKSLLKPDADRDAFTEPDETAFLEAKESDAFLCYFGGTPNAEGRSRNFCLWTDREEAKRLSNTAAHKEAKKLAGLYEEYSLTCFEVRMLDGWAIIRKADSEEEWRYAA